MQKVLISLLAIQALTTLAIAIGFFVAYGAPSAAAALYGGAIAMALSALLAWRMQRASRPGASAAGLYLGAMERMVFVAAAFVLALAVLKLAPLALIVAFVGAELAYYVAGGLLRRRA
ncbi:MAG: ATP synthase subunit I [Gammaproteobacteria bacterium]